MRTLTDEQIDQLNSLSVLLGIVAFGVSCAVAVPLASFFRTSELAGVIVLLSTLFVVAAFQIVPYGLLQREKAFKQLALADAGRGLTQAVVTVTLAAMGWRYWSLVWGNIAGSTISVLAMLIWQGRGFARPTRGALTPAIAFSRDVLVSRISWYAYANADFVVAGRVLGQDQVGVYTVAWNLASTAIDKLTDLISRVGPAFVADAQADLAGLRSYVRHVTRAISLITFPVTLGLSIVAFDFIVAVLGVRWKPAVAPLRLLALYACIRSITTLFGPLLSAIDVRWASRYSLVFPFVLPLAFLAGSRFGTVGIAAAWACVYPVLYIPIYRRIFRRLDMRLLDYLGSLWPALSASLVMVAVEGVLVRNLPGAWSSGIRLSLEVSVGALTYVAVLPAALRHHSAAIGSFVKAIVRGVGQ
jgi:O-antigen/teichoic acid export membrane protein